VFFTFCRILEINISGGRSFVVFSFLFFRMTFILWLEYLYKRKIYIFELFRSGHCYKVFKKYNIIQSILQVNYCLALLCLLWWKSHKVWACFETKQYYEYRVCKKQKRSKACIQARLRQLRNFVPLLLLHVGGIQWAWSII
jgi:hypothetical protein